jgi:FkbM family methyltransferase
MPLADIAHINPSSVLDIGANTGDWYREAKTLWMNAQYLLIEGNPACLPWLTELDLKRGPHWIPVYLGKSYSEVKFYKRKGSGTDTGNSYYRELTEFFSDDQIVVEDVQLHRLDDTLPDSQFDLIKIDTQGSELDILRGGERVISKAKHVLLEVSIVPYNEGAPLRDEIVAYMRSIGFPKMQIIGDIVHPIERHIIQHDILFSR